MSDFVLPVKVFCVLKDGAKLPEYKTDGAAGADLFAFLENPVIIKPFERKLITTGVFVQIPKGYELQLRPRSGLALKHGITVLNSPGTIDSDYRGEILVLLINLGETDFVVENGQRIAQVILAPVVKGGFEIVNSLEKTTRGSAGYGSTGLI